MIITMCVCVCVCGCVRASMRACVRTCTYRNTDYEGTDESRQPRNQVDF